jgi:quinol monooxygenase YgiN
MAETMLIVDIEIKPGRANAFKAAAAALFERTRDEPDTLRYEYFMSDDETRNFNIEVFRNADGFVKHNRNVADIVGALFENADVVKIDVVGDVNDDLYAELDGLKLKHFVKLGGVTR